MTIYVENVEVAFASKMELKFVVSVVSVVVK